MEAPESIVLLLKNRKSLGSEEKKALDKVEEDLKQTNKKLNRHLTQVFYTFFSL